MLVGDFPSSSSMRLWPDIKQVLKSVFATIKQKNFLGGTQKVLPGVRPPFDTTQGYYTARFARSGKHTALWLTEWLCSLFSKLVPVSTFNLGVNAAESTHHTKKKASNKRCLKLNFDQKSLQAHLSICPWSGGRGLEKSIWWKYDIVLKWQNTFKLQLNAAKSTHHTKKKLQINVVWN